MSKKQVCVKRSGVFGWEQQKEKSRGQRESGRTREWEPFNELEPQENRVKQTVMQLSERLIDTSGDINSVVLKITVTEKVQFEGLHAH